MKRKIKTSERRLVKQQMVLAEKMQATHRKSLLRKRNKEVKRVLKGMLEVEPAQAETYLSQELNESYLPSELSNIHRTTGYYFGEAELDRWAEVYGVKSIPLWQLAVDEWSRRYIGEHITSISGTLRDDMIGWLNDAVTSSPEMSIEQVVMLIQEDYNASAEWQVRRIVHTESMTALGLGQYESVNSLGIETLKTWTITALNTRPEHMVMDGVQVEMEERFNMPNGDMLLFPRDTSLGISASNRINCQCGTIYEPKYRI